MSEVMVPSSGCGCYYLVTVMPALCSPSICSEWKHLFNGRKRECNCWCEMRNAVTIRNCTRPKKKKCNTWVTFTFKYNDVILLPLCPQNGNLCSRGLFLPPVPAWCVFHSPRSGLIDSAAISFLPHPAFSPHSSFFFFPPQHLVYIKKYLPFHPNLLCYLPTVYTGDHWLDRASCGFFAWDITLAL